MPIRSQPATAASSSPSPSSGSPAKTRHPEPVAGQAHVLGDELPGEVDRAVLEVVAEREVAEHLEEREVTSRRGRPRRCRCPCRRAKHLLHGGEPRRGRLLRAEKYGFSGCMPARDEQRRGGRRAAGSATPTGEARCALRLEEGEEALAQLGASSASGDCRDGDFTPRSRSSRLRQLGAVDGALLRDWVLWLGVSKQSPAGGNDELGGADAVEARLVSTRLLAPYGARGREQKHCRRPRSRRLLQPTLTAQRRSPTSRRREPPPAPLRARIVAVRSREEAVSMPSDQRVSASRRRHRRRPRPAIELPLRVEASQRPNDAGASLRRSPNVDVSAVEQNQPRALSSSRCGGGNSSRPPGPRTRAISTGRSSWRDLKTPATNLRIGAIR